MNEFELVEADKLLIDGAKARLPRWIDEAGLIAEMHENTERSGTRADVRTAKGASDLLDDVQQWERRIAEAEDCRNPSLRVQKRILHAALKAIIAEAKGPTEGLKNTAG